MSGTGAKCKTKWTNKNKLGKPSACFVMLSVVLLLKAIRFVWKLCELRGEFNQNNKKVDEWTVTIKSKCLMGNQDMWFTDPLVVIACFANLRYNFVDLNHTEKKGKLRGKKVERYKDFYKKKETHELFRGARVTSENDSAAGKAFKTPPNCTPFGEDEREIILSVWSDARICWGV